METDAKRSFVSLGILLFAPSNIRQNSFFETSCFWHTHKTNQDRRSICSAHSSTAHV